MRGKIAVGLSALSLILLPACGAVAGAFITLERTQPGEPACGQYVLPQLLAAGFGTLAGGAVGAGIGCPPRP
jgi:hypothetical protein